MIYSTRPRVGTGEDGVVYYLKGPDPAVITAEALAYQLASSVRLKVPDFAMVEVPGEGVCFGCRAIRVRSALEEILAGNLAVNPELLAECIVFDTWIANDDRNMGNIVYEPERVDGFARARLHAIDFEKAAVLRGKGVIEIGMIGPRAYWPNEQLGRLARGSVIPSAFCDRIAAIKESQVDGAFEALAWEFRDFDLSWREAAVQQLLQRAAAIRRHVEEVWQYGS
jgi:hypothetical protein